MKSCQRAICIFLLSMVCIILLAGCSDKIENEPPEDQTNLDEWLGDYSFYEFYPPNINMEYNINVSKEEDEYYANINIDGFQTNKRIKAKVLSNQDGINLVFDTYLSDSTGEDLNKGDVLLDLYKVDSEIYTNWGKIEPILPENQTPGKVYFEKVLK